MNNKNTGFVFIEILIAITLVSVFFITLIGIAFLALSLSVSIKNKTQADFLVKEELEIVRNFRDNTEWSTDGLGSLNYGEVNPYYFTVGGSSYQINPGTETVGIFTRNVFFEKVYRDNTTNFIVPTGCEPTCAEDQDTKKVVVTVSFNGIVNQVVTYLTNW